ncbi:uncharacterized protein [Centruroides vittatus]|uniref:uncharacterized protein n=1 Tax=Centruroides vittatus TaxID=120091 RepID=UPI003510BF99
MLLYAASSSGHVTSKNSVASKLLSLQRQFAIRILKCYKTVSITASLIAAEFLPLPLCIVKKVLNYYIRTTNIKTQQQSLPHTTAVHMLPHCNYPTISDPHPVINVIPRVHLVSSAITMHTLISTQMDPKALFMSAQVSVSSSKLTYFVQNMLKWPTFGTILLCTLTLTGIIYYIWQLIIAKYITIVGLSINLQNFENLFLYVYQKPYFTHLCSYCFGLLIGYALVKKKQLNFQKMIVISCWAATICFMGLVLFGLHNYRNDPSPNESIILAHQILSPIAWMLVTAWICVACLSGYGGVVNKFLSMDFFVIMDRLTIWIYLVHPAFILYLFGEFRSPHRFTQISLCMTFLLVMALSIIASVFCYVFLQIPFTYFVSKIFMSGNSKKNVSNDNENQKMQTFKKWNLPIFHTKTLWISRSERKKMDQ